MEHNLGRRSRVSDAKLETAVINTINRVGYVPDLFLLTRVLTKFHNLL